MTDTTYQATRSEAKRIATMAALETLALATETASRLRELEAVKGDLPVCIGHDAPIAARNLSAMVERMAASLRSNTGTIR